MRLLKNPVLIGIVAKAIFSWISSAVSYFLFDKVAGYGRATGSKEFMSSHFAAFLLLLSIYVGSLFVSVFSKTDWRKNILIYGVFVFIIEFLFELLLMYAKGFPPIEIAQIILFLMIFPVCFAGYYTINYFRKCS